MKRITKFFALATLLVAPHGAIAADVLSLSDFTIQPGQRATIELLLDNETPYKSLQCDFDLPEGLSIVSDNNGKPIFTATDRTPMQMIQGSHPKGTAETHYRLGIISYVGTIVGNSGAIVTFEVQASNRFGGVHDIALTEIQVGDENNVSHDLADYTAGVTCGKTLDEILAQGEEGGTYAILDDLAVMGSADVPQQVFVTDGHDNWLALAPTSGIYGDVAAMVAIKGGTVVGELTDIGTHPTLSIDVLPTEGEELDITPLRYDLADRFAPKPCEVLTVTGYLYTNEDTPKLRGYYGPSGQSADLDFSWLDDTSLPADGARCSIVAVADLKQAWDAPADGDAPQRIAADDDLAFRNYNVHALSVPTVTTGIRDVAADTTEVECYYDLQGRRYDTPVSGVNIVRHTDGTATKLLVK